MASITSCSLCCFSCCEFKSLYDDNGEISAVYQVAVKYFDPLLLDAETEPNLRVVCLDCWQHIIDFYSFQQWILNAQEDLNFVLQEEKPSEQILSSYITDSHTNTTKINSTNSNDSNLSSLDLVDAKDNNNTFISKINGKLKCDKCKEIFQSYVALQAHFQLFHSTKCTDEKFNTNSEFVERQNDTQTELCEESHYQRDENSFKCKTCGASFSQYGNLRRHVRKKHAVQPLLKWTCKYCNKMFKKRSLMERHKNKFHKSIVKPKSYYSHEENCKTDSEPEEVEMHKESKILNCNVKRFDLYQEESSEVNNCQQNCKQTSYNTRFSMSPVSDDITVESEINPNVQIHRPALDIVDIKSEISTDAECDEDANKVTNNINSNEFTSDVEEYDDLLENWKGDFECPRCSHRIQNYLQLSEHFGLEHPDERCYINCCHLTLYDQQRIEEHLQFHKNPNTFKCTDCGKCFKNRKGLSSHKLQVHSDKRSAYHLHLCYCKRAMELDASNQSKGQTMEYDTFICCQRKKKILEDDALIAKWKQELTCDICKTTFSYHSLMRAHFYHAHPGEKCYISCCQRKMSRISDALAHIRFHLDPHAYRCSICKLDFSAKNTLIKHMRNAHTDSLPKHRWACDECDKTFEIRQILTRHKNVTHPKKV